MRGALTENLRSFAQDGLIRQRNVIAAPLQTLGPCLVAPQKSSIRPDGRCAATHEGDKDEAGERSENRTDCGDDQAEDRQDEGEHSDGVGDVVVFVLHHKLCRR